MATLEHSDVLFCEKDELAEEEASEVLVNW